ncbi:Hypothetical_protein [Hexamita inflata]|uniref:Hypothetical_protein n=1 Tax=Hexamita inflata TaxID=28002 RepID=A0AA86TSL9_9EUKA|nr:Hypothetical protein HINF_LOCUS14776 [Hexamita inflata]
MRLGQIGCGRQNPPVQSAELASSRICMAKGMPSTNLQDWKAATAPLLPQKRRWYDAGGFPYRSARTKQPRYAPRCLYPSRWLHWLRRCAQRTQVYLKLMIIRVNLQFLYRRPNQYKRKLSEWDIYICSQLIRSWIHSRIEPGKIVYKLSISKVYTRDILFQESISTWDQLGSIQYVLNLIFQKLNHVNSQCQSAIMTIASNQYILALIFYPNTNI